jgi:uncharacterized protein YndB with AHSA1/START domain
VSPNRVAKASTTIRASSAAVWKALTDPKAIKRYMFGADVTSEWREGSAIAWRGEFEGKAYEDKGTILQIKRLCNTVTSARCPGRRISPRTTTR